MPEGETCMSEQLNGQSLPAHRYEIFIRGHMGETVIQAFPGLQVVRRGKDTLLVGALADQAALHGVLSQIEALGLELLEVRRVSP
jgi:hypothetical protein